MIQICWRKFGPLKLCGLEKTDIPAIQNLGTWWSVMIWRNCTWVKCCPNTVMYAESWSGMIHKSNPCNIEQQLLNNDDNEIMEPTQTNIVK